MRSYRVGFLLVLTLVAVISILSPSNLGAENGGGTDQGCCDCWVELAWDVCVQGGASPEECVTTLIWDWVSCHAFDYFEGEDDPTDPGGSGGGGAGPGPTDPRDLSEEAREESAMCLHDDVLITRHCNLSFPTFECCYLNSDDGHLCTTCNCAGCCETYFNCDDTWLGATCRACKLDCAVNFQSGAAAGWDNSADCGLTDEGTTAPAHHGDLPDV